MAYPTRLLRQDEQVALDLQPHWWFFAKQIGMGLGLILLIGLIFGFLGGGDTRDVATYAWAIVVLGYAIWLAIKYLDWRFTHFVVTDQRVIFRTGVLAKRGVEIPLNRINNINFRQRIFERFIGAGNLEIESAGKDGQSTFTDVRHPDGVQHVIYEMIETNEQRRAQWSTPQGVPAAAPAPTAASAPSAPSSAPASLTQQIEELADLRDRGLITAAEYETKKAQLLERM
jgi:uncharacterized membrane protein YdbT with pleckstrin-like domain